LGWLGWILKNLESALKNQISIRAPKRMTSGWRSLDSIPKSALEARPRGVFALEPFENNDWPAQGRRPNQVVLMRNFKLRPLPSSPWIAALMALLLWAPSALLAESYSPAARRIDSYYQQLLPTLKAAGSLSVRERDRRFGPAITSTFDIATMTRLASGPAWGSFSGAQQAAVREAFAQFLVADYAHEVSDYSGESFVVDPQTSPESRGGGEIVKTKLIQPGGRTVQINYLVRGGRVIDVYLNGTVSDLATRRDEFASILAGGGGADALVKTLRERTATLLAG
jgi:phospholipid transport system substrate-binding protein